MSVNYVILRNSVEQAAWLALTSQQRADQIAWEASHVGVDPGNFKGKKYKIIQPGYKPVLRDTSRAEETIGGLMDISLGHVYYTVAMTFKVDHTLSATLSADKFGSFANLKALFLLKNPSPTAGQPSNVLTLVDHYGVEHDGVFLGEFSEQPQTTVLEGSNATYYITLQFVQLQAMA